jgi:hypothetical protein
LEVHVPAGCTHEADTLLKVDPVVAKPDQLLEYFVPEMVGVPELIIGAWLTTDAVARATGESPKLRMGTTTAITAFRRNIPATTASRGPPAHWARQ